MRRVSPQIGAGAVIMLLAAGGQSASADVVAPTSTTSAHESFVVLVGSYPAADPIEVIGTFASTYPTDDPRQFGVALDCDDGRMFPVYLTVLSGGSAAGWFTSAIPQFEEGHTCTVHGSAPAGRRLVFGAPWNHPTDDGSPRLTFVGSVISATPTGGL